MSPPVMIFGAYGHTGRFVLDELRRRGSAVVMSGRDPARLAELAVTGDLVRPAEVTDPGALSRAADGCAAILNCAGPFAETASPLVETALRLGIPYLGVAGEPGVVADIFARYDAPARERSILLFCTSILFTRDIQTVTFFWSQSSLRMGAEMSGAASAAAATWYSRG